MGINEETLFNVDEYKEAKIRKAPKSEAEKRIREIAEMEDRDFKNLKTKLSRGETLTSSEAKRLQDYRKRYEEESGRFLPPGVVRTQREVADFFGCHIQTIKNWCARGMPRYPDSYDPAAIKAWAVKEGLIKGESVNQGDDSSTDESRSPDRAYWDRENAKAQAEGRKLKNQILEGKLIFADDAYRHFFEAARMARDAILNIGPVLATSLARDPTERAAVLKGFNKDVTEILEELVKTYNAKR